MGCMRLRGGVHEGREPGIVDGHAAALHAACHGDCSLVRSSKHCAAEPKHGGVGQGGCLKAQEGGGSRVGLYRSTTLYGPIEISERSGTPNASSAKGGIGNSPDPQPYWK